MTKEITSGIRCFHSNEFVARDQNFKNFKNICYVISQRKAFVVWNAKITFILCKFGYS